MPEPITSVTNSAPAPLSTKAPTAGSTLRVVAGLFRALVDTLLAGRDGGGAWEDPSPTLLAAAFWRAARAGLGGDLVDVDAGRPRPAP